MAMPARATEEYVAKKGDQIVWRNRMMTQRTPRTTTDRLLHRDAMEKDIPEAPKRKSDDSEEWQHTAAPRLY